MFKVGDMVLVDMVTYIISKIENDVAHLKDIVNPKGRPKQMSVEYLPYFDTDGNYVVPQRKKVEKFNVSGKISLRAMVKEHTDMAVSRDFIGFLKLWLEGAIEDLVVGAEDNANIKDQSTITAAHLFWWEMHPSQTTEGYWPNQIQHMRDINEGR